MSLTFGPGPFSLHTRGLLAGGEVRDGPVYAEPYPRRLRAFVGGQPVVDTEGAWMVHAAGQMMTLWFPADAVDRTGLPDGAVTNYPLGDDVVARALADFVFIDPAKADRWFLEDEPVYAHVKDPYHRVDVVASHRHVRVEHLGEVLADSTRPRLLFETGLPVRCYLPWADVRLHLLAISDTVSECPYKGDGQHWNLQAGEHSKRDVAWSLPHPLPEGLAAAEHVCFYPHKVSVVVDGVPLAR